MIRHLIILASVVWMLGTSCETINKNAEVTSAKTAAEEKKREEERLIQERLEAERMEQERIRIKLQEEKKEQRQTQAYGMVKDFTETIMKRISPLSGENARYTILSTDYDYDTEKIQLVFQSEWYGLPAGFESYKENHLLKATLTLYHDGIYRYELLEQNDALARAIKATQEQEALAEILIELSKE